MCAQVPEVLYFSCVCARRGDARDARSLFAFYLQIESRAGFSERCRYSVRSATSGGSGLRARARVWGRGSARGGAIENEIGVVGFGAREPHHSADFTRMPAHALYRQHTPRTFPREGEMPLYMYTLHPCATSTTP